MPPSKKVTTKSSSKKKKRKDVGPLYSLQLSKEELEHFRNMMSIVLPPTGEIHLGEALLQASDLDEDVDSSLWDKVWALCEEAGLDVGDDAPDFIVGPAEPTPLKVYRVNLDEDPDEDEE